MASIGSPASKSQSPGCVGPGCEWCAIMEAQRGE